MVEELSAGDPREVGPYRLTGVLGSGGMGRVFLALSPGGRPVAVKVVKAELAADPEFRARFRREVTAARSVSGLYTAPVVDADLEGPVPWLATAYVDGPSLAQAVSGDGPLPAASLPALAAGLAEALAAIHRGGLVHRDLKPSNILLAADGPRVIDFGISHAAETTTLTVTGQYLGSPGFLSPEQAEGRDVTPATDIFSLGAVLTFAATGAGPFGAGSLPALVYRVVHAAPELDGVPDEIKPLVAQCLAKQPADRPTASALLASLSGFQPGERWLPGLRAGAVADAAPTDPPRTVTAARRAAPADGAPVTRSRRIRPVVLWPAVGAAVAAAVTAVTLAVAGGGAGTLQPSAAIGGPGPARVPGGGSADASGRAAEASAQAVVSARHTAKPSARAARKPAARSTHPATSAPGASNPASPAGPPAAPATPTPAPTAAKPPPVPSYYLSASGASEYACSGAYDSAQSTSEVTYTFANDSRYTVQLYWMTFAGAPDLYATMGPGQETSWHTYVGHYWMIAGQSGQCQGVFRVNAGGTLTVT